jgi:hypothetical protein
VSAQKNDGPYCGPGPCRSTARTANGRDLEAFHRHHPRPPQPEPEPEPYAHYDAPAVDDAEIDYRYGHIVADRFEQDGGF